MEYGYVYHAHEHPDIPGAADRQDRSGQDPDWCQGTARNVSASMAEDAWRAENAPTAEVIRARASAETLRWRNKRGATQDLAASNGSHEPPAPPVELPPSVWP